MKALTATLRKEAIVEVICWELKSHLFKVLVLPIFSYGTKIWGCNLKISHWKVFENGKKDTYNVSCQSAFFDYLSYCVGRTWRPSHRIIHSETYYGLSTMTCPLIPLLVSQKSSLTLLTRNCTNI